MAVSCGFSCQGPCPRLTGLERQPNTNQNKHRTAHVLAANFHRSHAPEKRRGFDGDDWMERTSDWMGSSPEQIPDRYDLTEEVVGHRRRRNV